jgi:hypothetical protein
LPDQPICALIRNAQPAAQVQHHHTKSPDVPRRASASLGFAGPSGRLSNARNCWMFCCPETGDRQQGERLRREEGGASQRRKETCDPGGGITTV